MNLYLCDSCKKLYFSIADISNHIFYDCNRGKKALTEEADPPKQCNVKEFLEWLMPSAVDDANLKYFSNSRFDTIRESKLPGAPRDCLLREFVMWVLFEAWGKDEAYQSEFVNGLLNPPVKEGSDFFGCSLTMCVYEGSARN
jgi:hypothetical protein